MKVSGGEYSLIDLIFKANEKDLDLHPNHNDFYSFEDEGIEDDGIEDEDDV